MPTVDAPVLECQALLHKKLYQALVDKTLYGFPGHTQPALVALCWLDLVPFAW